jgi:hypothetical protein
VVGRAQGLGVQHDRGRVLGPAGLLAGLAAQQVMNGQVGAVTARGELKSPAESKTGRNYRTNLSAAHARR